MGEDDVPESADHYFSAEPAVRSSPREVELDVAGRTVTLTTDAGVFSGREVDLGTRVLLGTAPLPSPAPADVLDLGCGYGPIAVSLGLRLPGSRVWAVDVNSRALGLTTANAAAAGLDNVVAAQPEAVPSEVRFGAIYSNPPIRIGKDELHALLDRWLPRLTPDGSAYLVVGRNLGADSLARWLESERGLTVVRLRSQKGYRVLQVRL